MANPTQAQIDKLTTNLGRWDDIVNAAASETIVLDSFSVRPVVYYLQQLTTMVPRGAWATATSYILKDIVTESSIVYLCTEAHTSGTFSTDLAAGKWAIMQLDTTNDISFGADFTVAVDAFHVDGTTKNVGIGTTSPSSLIGLGPFLEISGTGDAGLVITDTTLATPESYSIYSDSGALKFHDSVNGHRLTLGSNGCVGIAQTSPNASLDIAKTFSGDNLKITDSSYGSQIGMYTGSVIGTLMNSGGAFFISTESDHDLIFRVNTVESMRLDSATRFIGVNETSPDCRVHITDTVNVAYDLSVLTTGTNTLLKFENTSTTANAFAGMHFRVGSGADLFFGIIQQSGNEGDFYFSSQGSPNREMMRIKSNGYVGIGDNDPQTYLVVSSDSTTTVDIVGDNDNSDITSDAKIAIWIDGRRGSANGVRVGEMGYDGAENHMFMGYGTDHNISVDSNGNVALGTLSTLATSATNGFMYIPTCSGSPTGTPSTKTGKVPMVYDTSGNTLNIYSGGMWRSIH